MNFYSPNLELYSECNLPENIFLEFKEIVNCDKNNKIPYNSNLAGNIENEYSIEKCSTHLVEYLERKSMEFFLRNSQEKWDMEKYSLKLGSFWINKQKKYEFNPLHNHSGIVSFVCWIQIPYNLDDELNLSNCKNSVSPLNSLFSFAFTDFYGKLCQRIIKVDKSYEGKCIFFDSRLHHQVYPFYTSDDYRISVSGNFEIKPLNLKKISYN